MESSNSGWWWLCLILLTLFFVPFFLLKFISKRSSKLPPGPLTLPIIGNLFFFRKTFFQLKSVLRNLHAKYGPVISLSIGPRRIVIITDRVLAHQALIHNGAAFADRPPAPPISRVFNGSQLEISSARYDPTWRLLRRNITSEILQPLRIKSYSRARKWVLDILLKQLESDEQGSGVRVVDHFQYAMFCLLVLMCFGDKLDESKIKEIKTMQRRILMAFSGFNLLNICPSLTKILFRKRWQKLFQLRKEQHAVLIPLINSRKKVKETKVNAVGDDGVDDDDFVLCYVDTLMGLELPENKRTLETGEIVSLCSEFLNRGTDTTSTALQWIMANVVKYPEIQEKLYQKIKGVVLAERGNEIEEEDLQKMPYLKVVILEGLRRHPPAHFVLPHAVSEDVVVGGHVVPKNRSVNFMVAEMGLDPKVWEDPMAFKPKRFQDGNNDKVEFDIKGNREIKMMPFGAGRRICPASALAMHHLEYFVVVGFSCSFNFPRMPLHQLNVNQKRQGQNCPLHINFPQLND